MPAETDILFLIHDVARQLRVDADRRARAHGMTRAQWVILWWLERRPGLSQKELAELMDVEPITVARLVDRLARRGMVERRDDPTDRRIWRLHLQPPAGPVLAHMQGVRDQMQEVLTAGLDEATLAAAQAALGRMKSNLLAEPRARPAEPPPKPQPPARRPRAAARRNAAAPAGNPAETPLLQDRA